jgi:tetratricopeptide (TPR) repeat protein
MKRLSVMVLVVAKIPASLLLVVPLFAAKTVLWRIGYSLFRRDQHQQLLRKRPIRAQIHLPEEQLEELQKRLNEDIQGAWEKELQKELHVRIAAEPAFAEANLLAAQQKEDSFRQAAAKYEEAARLYHTLGERGKEAECLAGVGILSYQVGDLRKALEYYTQTLAVHRAVGNPALEAATLI